MAEEEIKYCKHCKENNCGNILCREKVNYIKTLEESIEDWKADHEHNLELMKGLNERIAELKKENEELKKNALVWHDLRKAPNDLPEERGDYWIKYDSASEEKGGFYDIHYFEPDKPFYKKHWSEIGVIKWCKLPKSED